jgi:hypothetical protein
MIKIINSKEFRTLEFGILDLFRASYLDIRAL